MERNFWENSLYDTEQDSAKPSSLHTTKRATAKGQKGANYGLKCGKRNSIFPIFRLNSCCSGP